MSPLNTQAIFTVVQIIVSVLAAMLPGLNLTGLTPTLIKLADVIVEQLPVLYAAIKSGAGKPTLEVTAALASIQAVAEEVKGDPQLSPELMNWLEELDAAAQRALAADTAAAAKIDPATLTDIPELS